MKKEEESCVDDICTRTICKCIDTKTPVKIEVSSALGDTSITCGRPRICSCRCRVKKKSQIEFTVHQCLMVEIPITYDVIVDANETSGECGLLE